MFGRRLVALSLTAAALTAGSAAHVFSAPKLAVAQAPAAPAAPQVAPAPAPAPVATAPVAAPTDPLGIALQQHLAKVHIRYFTEWVNDAGQLQTARDVYGHEQRIKLALAGKWGEIVKGPNHLAPVTVDPDVRASIYRNTRPNTVGDYVQSVLGGGF